MPNSAIIRRKTRFSSRKPSAISCPWSRCIASIRAPTRCRPTSQAASSACKATFGPSMFPPQRKPNTWCCRAWLRLPRCNGCRLHVRTTPNLWSAPHVWLAFTTITAILMPYISGPKGTTTTGPTGKLPRISVCPEQLNPNRFDGRLGFKKEKITSLCPYIKMDVFRSQYEEMNVFR